MPGIWQALLDTDTPCSLVTKSPLALRDIDILSELAAGPGVTVYFSVPTLDEKVWRETEPHTPSPRARLDAVRKMNDAGVPCGILVAPADPGRQRRARAGRRDHADRERERRDRHGATCRCTCAAR